MMENCCREKMIDEEIRILKVEERESDRQRKNKKSKNIGMNIKEDAAEVWKRKTRNRMKCR